MTQRERLVELILNSGVIEQFFDYEEQEAERLADYLLENGVIVPPCKVGDMAYAVDDGVVYKERINFFDLSVFTDNGVYSGEEIFATYEAAERALKEREVK